MRIRRITHLLAALLAFFSATSEARAQEHRVFGIYAVWFTGSHDADRERIDQFLDCLVHHSNLNQYWQGEAGIEVRGSWALPPPPERLDWDQLAEQWLTPNVGTPSGLPVPQSGETPLYLVFGGKPDVWVGACGRNSQATVADRLAGVGVVRNGEECWPSGDMLRTETQVALHEIVETVDRVLGYGTCAAGGACNGKAICKNPCDTFIGLECPGAPKASWTGCDKTQVDGWVIQKLGYAGRDPNRCESCAPCDFTPRVCRDDEPDCARVPPRIAQERSSKTFWGGAISSALLVLFAGRVGFRRLQRRAH
jgi:hypothetical protein